MKPRPVSDRTVNQAGVVSEPNHGVDKSHSHYPLCFHSSSESSFVSDHSTLRAWVNWTKPCDVTSLSLRFSNYWLKCVSLSTDWHCPYRYCCASGPKPQCECLFLTQSNGSQSRTICFWFVIPRSSPCRGQEENTSTVAEITQCIQINPKKERDSERVMEKYCEEQW